MTRPERKRRGIQIPALGVRLLTLALVVPLYMSLIWMGDLIWVAVVVWSAMLACYEYFGLCRQGGYPTNHKFGMLWCAVLIIRFSGAFSGVPLSLVITWGMIVLLASALFSRRTPFLTWLTTASGPMYIGICLALLVPIRQVDSGFWWLVLLMWTTYMADSGAYFVGSLWGRHKLAPEISPRKSWEGLGGALVFGSLMAMIIVLLSQHPGWLSIPQTLPDWPIVRTDWFRSLTSLEAQYFEPLPINLWAGLGVGFLIAVLGQLGDLTISMWKRHVGTKDSGTLFRGHGGMLDRIDSLLFTSPLIYSLILILV